METESREKRVNVRLSREDQEALAWLVAHINASMPYGMSVDEAKAVRWCLHTCRAALSVTSADE